MNNSKKEKSYVDELNLKIPDDLTLNFNKGIFLKITNKLIIKNNRVDTYVFTALPSTDPEHGQLNPKTIWYYNFIDINSGIRLTKTVKDTFKPKNAKKIITELINSLSGDFIYDKIELVYRTKIHTCKIQLKGKSNANNNFLF